MSAGGEIFLVDELVDAEAAFIEKFTANIGCFGESENEVVLFAK